jgi:hypothetical protein
MGAEPSIGTSDIASFAGEIRRATTLRWVIAAVVALLLGLSVLFALQNGEPPRILFTPGTSGIVVLDLSRSIDVARSEQAAAVLDQLAASGGRAGLIAFSDSAYELLPPGTPTRELKPIARFFIPIHRRGQKGPVFPLDPWNDTFRGGTVISNGLIAAEQALHRRHARNGEILLISDLNNDPNDLPRLVNILVRLQAEHIRLRLAALGAVPQAHALFERIEGADAFVTPTSLTSSSRSTTRIGAVESRAPSWALLVAAILLAAALAANELWCGRLTFRTEPA